ncbi:ribosomal protein uL16 3-hydroxylase [Paraburkholderia silvatlantica]|uniref:50S ribosomal protein L16 3-hydroxylase n=2 Tax=Paraburkholderia silvatlantica TaxID=321895 RepID=A0A2U1AHC2_9BURK|nr:cupin domain-containing protein [Paraburkholderia silvatlantica]PVY35807.1 50S ribosomal protein L16 3-hydroxylase [Paraburkholderia silvatlantica]PXW39755.1 50S ribosomal protein L16 3-hydroxylase [Paraburkholderia silvatlantica]PYE21968.1 50S ribosomal protein L16 3-hydroxylase [Paraburkholderia silvatlantica]TDQ99377.1 50S ribosomal protein L16 3-hydroxylase [Paraburkholderia silvatlantica]
MPKRSPDHPVDARKRRASLPPACPAPDVATPLLGGLTPAQFMRKYWQKKPLLIRQAIPDIEAPLSREALFALADNDDVESRLITHFRRRWALEHGPFSPDELPTPKTRQWTLLVQGADLHDDRARALLERFRFAPDARLDDLMISYASDGGGVGPHFDSYDVFLLQVHGKRRWRIGAQRDLSLQEGLPLKILANFQPEEEWVLEPGDMLYLPPHIAHDGIAEGECMTCSIGFRSPSTNELTSQFLYWLAERGVSNGSDKPTLYRDPDQPAVAHPAQLPPALVERVGGVLAKVRWSDADVSSFVGSWLSEPKANVVFDAPVKPLDEARFVAQAAKNGITLDRRTILLYDSRSYYLNGEQYLLKEARKWLPALADRRSLDGKRFVTLSHDSCVTALLHEWYRAGWIRTGVLA